MRSVLIVIFLSSLLAACSPNNVTVDDELGKYFTDNKVEGCFGLMDNGTGRFTVYNLSRYTDSSYLPASTFKIVNSLIGLQTGAISGDSMVIKWDGIPRRAAWDKDLNMTEAFRASSVPWYQEVARRIGKERMEHWLDTMNYAVKTDTQKVRITSPIDNFWLDNSMKITPDEQLGLVKQLYFNQLPFFKSNQEMVKQAMLQENNTLYRLGFKTGWGYLDENHSKSIGWIVGWIEENQHPYFFVLNLESKDPNIDMVTVRMKMLKDILKHLGFLEGKM